MMLHGFKINECEKCVYVKVTEHGYVILCLYVDDMLIIRSNDKMITSSKYMLNSRFDIKDIRLVDVLLGIKIIRTCIIWTYLKSVTLCREYSWNV